MYHKRLDALLKSRFSNQLSADQLATYLLDCRSFLSGSTLIQVLCPQLTWDGSDLDLYAPWKTFPLLVHKLFSHFHLKTVFTVQTGFGCKFIIHDQHTHLALGTIDIICCLRDPIFAIANHDMTQCINFWDGRFFISYNYQWLQWKIGYTLSKRYNIFFEEDYEQHDSLHRRQSRLQKYQKRGFYMCTRPPKCVEPHAIYHTLVQKRRALRLLSRQLSLHDLLYKPPYGLMVKRGWFLMNPPHYYTLSKLLRHKTSHHEGGKTDTRHV